MKKILLKMLALGLSVASLFSSFNTVSAYPTEYEYLPGDIYHNWAYYEIGTLIKDGIVEGYNPYMFAPNDYVTRGQTAKFIANTLNKKTSYSYSNEKGSFNDVKANNIYKNYIDTLKAYDIISGVDENNFAPNLNTKRAEMAKIMVNTYLLKEDKTLDDIVTTLEYTSEIKTDTVKSERKINKLVKQEITDEITREITVEISGENAVKEITKETVTAFETKSVPTIEIISNEVSYEITKETADFALLKEYKDYKDIPNWAKRYIIAAKKLGIMTGESGNVYPNRNVTRDELSAMVFRLFAYERDKTLVDPSIYKKGKGSDGKSYKSIVVIDPGHSKGEEGASYGSLKESYINWEIATMVKENLEKENILVYLTRQYSENKSLYERCQVGNGMGADMQVAIHCNASGGHGSESYISLFDKKVRGGVANSITNNISKVGFTNRGVKTRINSTKDDDYYGIIRNSKIPSMLIETAFIDNETDNWVYKTTEGKQKLANAISEGILSYYNK